MSWHHVVYNSVLRLGIVNGFLDDEMLRITKYEVALGCLENSSSSTLSTSTRFGLKHSLVCE